MYLSLSQDISSNTFFQDVFQFYEKARQSMNQCFENEGNKFLKEELGFPIDEMELREKSIKIVFSGRDFRNFIIEAYLLLYKGDEEFGKYTYCENENNEVVDDFLVFY